MKDDDSLAITRDSKAVARYFRKCLNIYRETQDPVAIADAREGGATLDCFQHTGNAFPDFTYEYHKLSNIRTNNPLE